MNRLKEKLKKHNIKPSLQRLLIFEFLDKNRKHPTAEDIFQSLCDKIPTLSRTTVYNTVHLFKKERLVQELTISGSESAYDINTDLHGHFHCTECGEICDIDIDPEGIRSNIEDVSDNISEIHVYLKGICKKCARERRDT